MKTFILTMSTSHAHTLEIRARDKDTAISKAFKLSNDEVAEQSINTWDVDTFPMLVDIEEDVCKNK